MIAIRKTWLLKLVLEIFMITLPLAVAVLVENEEGNRPCYENIIA